MKIHHVAASLGLLVSFTYVGACAVESPDQTEETDQSSSDALKACHHASDCKGPLPQLCEQCSDGSSACAHWECVNHKCVDTICPKPAPQCVTASDCHGVLPQICEQCPTGGSACAHWTCSAGKCVDKICN